MYASCETLFEVMDDLSGVLQNDGKGHAICFAIIDGVLRAIADKNEEHLTDCHRALSRVLAFVRAQDEYSTDDRIPFLAGRLCGLFEVVDIALKRITPAAVIGKIKDPKNASLIEILRGQEMELGELAAKLGKTEETIWEMLSPSLCEIVIVQMSGKQKFARLSLLAQEALKEIAQKEDRS